MSPQLDPHLAVLLVEDNPADVVFLREAFQASGLKATLHVVDNGQDALDFLRRQGAHTQAPRPDVMVLDLNLPIKTGGEVMDEMIAEPHLASLPVVILSTSTSESYLCDRYPGGKCLYFTKTDEFGKLCQIVRKISEHARAPRTEVTE